VSGAPLLTFVVPEGVDDPQRVSGGNVYDRRVLDGLLAGGWRVMTIEVADAAAVEAALAEVPDGGTVLVDGLVAAWAPEAIATVSATARVVVLAHMVLAAFPDADPVAVERERRALRAAALVIATSRWTAAELVERGVVDEQRVSVAVPGATDGPPALGPADHLLCVGAIAPHKGQDLLLDALGRLRELDWSCTLAGSSAADPRFAERIAETADGFGSRVRMTGVLADAELDAAYRRAGLLVAPSRTESFGMAIADARARGLPVIATAVGGIPESVAGGGAVLVTADEPAALASALEQWMTDAALRRRLRSEAAECRARSPRWSTTVERIHRILVTT